ncbi:general transcription factor 3C polypeptide 5 isoform X2 [Ambystoma mexicanum]|uniref:general transcription factor 3C polypeptide 5 isoform X2 n=1 Tax=Ambystoma mexicanum TaxID=8296 RepID=UPI0037E769D1
MEEAGEGEGTPAAEEGASSGPREPGSGALALNLHNKRMVCVEYPGQIHADPSRRLELYFRPKDPYCHPVCANRFPTTTMLLRVRRKTVRRKPAVDGNLQSEGSEPKPEIKMDILGMVNTVYKFQGMSDFQYLAVHMDPEGRPVSMYDKVLLRGPQKEEFFQKDVPLYVPPPIFSRLDTPVDYYYRPDIQHREGYNPPQTSSENLIGLSRARRPHNAIFINFEDEGIPTKPLEAAVQNWKRVCTNPIDKRLEEELKRLFEVRPIWSRNALKSNIGINPEKLKLMLPCVAYYMLTGPWRSLWVRFGYDPRKDPESKVYQVLDFRIRCGVKYGYSPNEMPVKAKRSTYNYSLPITLSAKKQASQPISMQDLKHGLGTSMPSGKKTPASRLKGKDSAFIFREGTLPPYRQMFYQLCDLNVDSLQQIIHRNDGVEAPCTERDGWCLPKTSDDLRDRMSIMIKQILRSKRPALFSSTSQPANNKEQLMYDSGEEEDEDEEEEMEFQPSDGSENEMETEILDYV